MELHREKGVAEQFHSLWIGAKLGETELLTLKSFLEKGHRINLWTYNEIKNVPEGILLRNANDIIPESSVFKYSDKGKIDWGKGSYAGFSDIFRYRLLYEYGGWWIDMDVTCLKKFEIEEDYFFRNHWMLPIVGNVIKCPPKSELMLSCYERAAKEINENNTDWHKPIIILNEEIKRLELLKYRKLGLFNLDMQHTIQPYLEKKFPFPVDWMGVHWINSSNFNYKRGSTFHTLLKQYGIKWL